MSDLPSVSDYFSGRTVLITGGTGFIGKVLIEKLLRSCDDVDEILLLVRPKRGMSVEERSEEMFKMKLFDVLREKNRNFREKIRPIESDITKGNLGLTPESEKMIVERVSVVFHSAATVKFNERLRNAIIINVVGTHEVIRLCKKIKNLSAFVHISTAFSNCDSLRPNSTIEEKVYQCNIHPQKLIDAVEWLDDNMCDKLTEDLLVGKPNTYTYTKALAEQLVMEECGNIPTAIVRPSIVMCSRKEPFPGWTDNANAVHGFMLAYATGFIQSLYLPRDGELDVIPVDTLVNLIISVAWYTAMHRKGMLTVYNGTSRGNALKCSTLASHYKKISRSIPFENLYRCPGPGIQYSYTQYILRCIFNIYPYAVIFDGICKLTGKNILPKRTTALQTYKKLATFVGSFRYFFSNAFIFASDNQDLMRKCLSPEDKMKFEYEMKDLDYVTFVRDCHIGIKTFLLREKMENLPKARRNFVFRNIVEYAVYFIIFVGLLLVVSNCISSSLWEHI